MSGILSQGTLTLLQKWPKSRFQLKRNLNDNGVKNQTDNQDFYKGSYEQLR